jgi:hypothetical protein
MRRWSRLGINLALSLVGCSRACGSSASGEAPGAAPVDAAVAIADATAAPAQSADASTSLSPEQRGAYAKAIGEGRAATRAKKYDDAIVAFGRALDAVANDARALAERGYARHLKGDEPKAEDDLERAALVGDPKDKKLLAQIEFNLGLVCDALSASDDSYRGKATGHYRRSYELNPTPAAKTHMEGCPVSYGPGDVTLYASADEAKAKIGSAGEWSSYDEKSGVLVGGDDNNTELLLPLANGRVAQVEVGSVALWHCGSMGEVTAERTGGVWTIVYQAHRGVAGPGYCVCNDEEPCNSPNGITSPDAPPCKCAEPMCPMSCGPSQLPEGSHIEAYVDAQNGRSLWRWEGDHSFLDAPLLKDQVTVDVDVPQRRFKANGLGCAVDVAIKNN